MSLSGKVVLLTPAGIGGIATYSRELERFWALGDPKISVWKVPRSTFVGWFLYAPKLTLFFFCLLIARPKVVHVNLASKGSPIRKFPYVCLARLFKIKVVTQLHSGRFHDDLMKASGTSIWLAITKRILYASEKLIFINQTQMNALLENGFASKHQCFFLPNHVHLPSIREYARKSVINDAVFIGRFSKEKGANELIRALEMLSGSPKKIAVVGSVDVGGFKPGKLALIGRHEVTFFGEVPHPKAMSILESSRMLVLPSHSENFPMVILEAFARGVPVIASRVGAVPNIIEDGKDGLLVNTQDSRDLHDKLRHYFDTPQLVHEHGVMARKKVEQLYDIQHYAAKLTEIYFSER
jgi:glycosyltransferase involved in cell wall biosynthesis